MISLKDGIRALVRIDFQGNVHKHFRGTEAFQRCENEVKVLQALSERGCPNVPKLVSFNLDEHYIVTSNCGKTVEQTISKKKAKLLFAELEEVYGVLHQDQEPRNITYNQIMGKFCIIDFELAEILPWKPLSSERLPKVAYLRWGSLSQKGKRHTSNQDHILSYTKSQNFSITSAEQGEIILPTSFACFTISDGVSGNHGGEFASKLLLNTFRYNLKQAVIQEEATLTKQIISSLLLTSHEALNKQATENPHAINLSATFVGLFFSTSEILWINVGDSRLYRYREGTLEQLSKDHNFPFRQWKRGELTEFQYRTHPKRNVLCDVIGGGHQNISPEQGGCQWKRNDLYLLCSDGIVNGLTERKIHAHIEAYLETKAQSPQTSSQTLADTLIKQAYQNCGSDDTSCIVVDLC